MFTKYSSITNHYNSGYIQKCLDLGIEYWQVTEKLHGANFSFLVVDGVISSCTRNRVLTFTDKFYNFHILDKYNDRVLELYKWLECEVLQLYGEYVGTQKGIDYGESDFYCFDIKVNGKYLSTNVVEGLCANFKIPHVPIIKEACSLKEALDCNNEFNSLVLNKIDNVCEGTVIKPVDYIEDYRGNRVIIKSKNEKWSEKSKVKKPKITKLSKEAQARLQLLLQYATENRVNAVISKDPIKCKQFGVLLGTTAVDALEEAKLDNPNIEFSDVTKEFMKYLTKIVRPVFLKEIHND